MRIEEVLAPANEEGTKATVLRWCKAVGETIRRDEPLLELETDKVTVEIASPASGELAEILTQPNEEVLPGQVLARVRVAAEGREGAEAPAPAAVRAPAAGQAPAAGESRARAGAPGAPAADGAEPAAGRELLSPVVRRLLHEHSLSAQEIPGSGRGGRITAQDVARHLEDARAAAGAAAAGATPLRVPHTPIRRRIALHMSRSLAEAPHVTTLFEADLTRIEEHRARHRASYERQGARLTLTAYFVAACARALAAHPSVNATFHEDALELHPEANIGVGTALGNDGLIVPVIHGAERLDLGQIAERLGQLVSAARAGKLAPQDVRGGTFTISNHGVSGSLLAAPIVIHQPQVAILGVGKVERRVCVLQAAGSESIGIRSRCYLTLTIDHRALDAFQANAFLSHVVATLESWPDEAPA